MILQPGGRPIPNCPDYVLVKKRGAGAFGQVWHARGPGGLDVALKFIRLDAQVFALELRSLEVMKKIRHPNLVSLFGAWHQDDWLILAMELCDGTLQDRLAEALGQDLPGIPLDELLNYMADAANGLDALNAKQVQHRDVKPANLLLLDSGVKVADFGLAKALEQTVASNSGAGTIAYLAPECFNGELTQQSDQYSLAVSYYHLRTGDLLFQGNQAQMMYAHLNLKPDLSRLPPTERFVLARALSKEPGERWRDCKAFVSELKKAQQELAKQAAEQRERLEERKREQEQLRQEAERERQEQERQKRDAEAAERKRQKELLRQEQQRQNAEAEELEWEPDPRESEWELERQRQEQEFRQRAAVGVERERERMRQRQEAKGRRKEREKEQLRQEREPLVSIGNYTLLAKIVEDRMGSVYKGQHKDSGQVVAIKFLPNFVVKNEVLLQRFANEWRRASNIDHPNIVRALEYCGTGGTPFLVMEYVDGESLHQKLVREKRIIEAESIRIVGQVAQGLHWAHKMGVIHRDVRPGNIMIARDGTAKLADLGLVVDMEDLPEADFNIGMGAAMLKPPYMAPELVNNAKNAAARCDVYALAATLYHMVTGKVPFADANGQMPPQKIVSGLSERVDVAIRRAMSGDPNLRPASCRRFVDDLTGHSTGKVSSHTDQTGMQSTDLWYLVYKDDEGTTHTVKGSTDGIRRSLKERLLGDASNVRVCRQKCGPFEPLETFQEFRDLVS
ncbi:MAG: protein kinase [Planctomycetia bacterium]|nr:protein kinase [Planctomycetia bacterium]